MPYAARRRDPALNMAYAHVSEPEFNDTAAALTDKLLDMGFTDEEVRGSVQADGLAADAQGTLFDPSPVRTQPVWQVPLADSDDVRTALDAMREEGVEWVPAADGSLSAGIKGAVPDAVAERIIAMATEADRPLARAALDKHRAKVEARRSLAEKGAVIFVAVEATLSLADSRKLEIHPLRPQIAIDRIEAVRAQREHQRDEARRAREAERKAAKLARYEALRAEFETAASGDDDQGQD